MEDKTWILVAVVTFKDSNIIIIIISICTRQRRYLRTSLEEETHSPISLMMMTTFLVTVDLDHKWVVVINNNRDDKTIHSEDLACKWAWAWASTTMTISLEVVSEECQICNKWEVVVAIFHHFNQAVLEWAAAEWESLSVLRQLSKTEDKRLSLKKQQ